MITDTIMMYMIIVWNESEIEVTKRWAGDSDFKKKFCCGSLICIQKKWYVQFFQILIESSYFIWSL